uniref:Palmitoyltransferase n=1 Tax=Wuchereria bancrofti TaxID=6293 RepID=A0A1I8EX55_WUCBA
MCLKFQCFLSSGFTMKVNSPAASRRHVSISPRRVKTWQHSATQEDTEMNFTVEGTFERSLYLSVFHLLLFMFLWSYYVTIFRPVGRPPKMFYVDSQTRQDLSSLEESECRQILERYVRQHQIPVDNRNGDGSMVYVTVTNVIASNLIDATIALKFDHHCPWVNTCINYFNYKFFLQFLFYGLILCLWGILTDLQYFIAFWKNAFRLSAGFSRFHIVFLFFVAGMFAASITCLFVYHVYLTARNQSTIESFRPPVFIYGIDKNGFNLGIRRNFRQVFGDTYLFWFLPIFSSYGDGVQYPVGSRARQQSHGLHCTGKFICPSLRACYALCRSVHFTMSGSGITFHQKDFRAERKKLLLLDANDDDDIVREI